VRDKDRRGRRNNNVAALLCRAVDVHGDIARDVSKVARGLSDAVVGVGARGGVWRWHRRTLGGKEVEAVAGEQVARGQDCR